MARRFNGTSDYIEYGAAAVTAVPITMACWFKADTQPTTSYVLMAIGDSAATTRVQLVLLDPAVIRASVFGTSGSNSVDTSTSAPVGQWHHACGVFESATARSVFLNGRGKGSSATNIVLGTPTVTTIGARYSAGVRGLFWPGLVAEAAVWNVALGDTEIALLGLGYSPLLIRPANLVSYWPLTGQYSPNEIDLKGRFDAVVNGAKPAIADHPPMIPRRRRSRALDFAAYAMPLVAPPAANQARIIFSHA